MTAITKLLGGALLSLTLAGGLASPSWADKISQTGKNPSTPAATTPATPPTTTASDIDFGDDTSEWAKDGECDDPRFRGEGSADELVDADIGKDATDCRAAIAAGTVEFTGDAAGSTDTQTATTPSTPTTAAAAIDFGDDTSEWAKDGECDDPRFRGEGSADELVDADIGKDATDCRAALAAGTVEFTGGDAGGTATATATATPAIDYGDDTSEWAKDGECDDPRFSGEGVAEELLDADLGHDATDCRAAVDAGTATFSGGANTATATTTPAVAAFDYGGDWSKWANDGECDDLRFQGEGTSKKLLAEDQGGDATDCKALEADGKVTIRTVYTPEYAAGAPYDSKGIDWGDNTSSYADDEMCDDPRFEGPGAASVLLDSDNGHDGEDCRKAFEAGTIMEREGA